MSEDEIINLAIDGILKLNHIDSYREESGLTREEAFNSLSISVARRYQSQSLTYEEADYAANLIWSAMVQDCVDREDQGGFAQPAYDIYEAFDAGEYDHGDGDDPIEKYTKPRIKEILENA